MNTVIKTKPVLVQIGYLQKLNTTVARILFGGNVAVGKSKKNFTTAGAMAILTFSLAAFGWIQLVETTKETVVLLLTMFLWLYILAWIVYAAYKKVFNHNFFTVLFTWAFIVFEILRLREIVDWILLFALLAVWAVVTVTMANFYRFGLWGKH